MRRGVAVAAAIIAIVASGCGNDGVTRARVEDAVEPTFANLFVLAQAQHGHREAIASMHTRAQCVRGDGSAAAKGAGADWTCNLTWTQSGGVPAGAAYSLTIQPNGCYTAEGDGPADLNRSPTIVALDGKTVTNPLWGFDGCFDVG